MKRYVSVFTMWSDDEITKGDVIVECSELEPKEHSEILELLEANKFIITEVNATEIEGSLELPYEELYETAKQFIAKGFEWKPESNPEK